MQCGAIFKFILFLTTSPSGSSPIRLMYFLVFRT
jgi:hypothetical protein